MDVIETIDYKGCKINIYQDENPLDPRENDNLGKMLCFHKRYSLGDKTDLKSEQFSSWREIKEYLIKTEKAVVVLPLFLLDHSGITMRVARDFSDCDPGSWDSGQVGFIYATKDDILKEYSCKKITVTIKKKVIKLLYAEIETYDDYLTGNVYGYVTEDEDEKQIESCFGYFGDYRKNGIIDDARFVIDKYVEEETKKKEKKLKSLIKNKVNLERRVGILK